MSTTCGSCGTRTRGEYRCGPCTSRLIADRTGTTHEQRTR